MTIYYVLYFLFVLFQGSTNGAYATFKGASEKAHKFLGTVTGIGSLAFIIISILHFFILEWLMALILIIVSLLLIPTIGMKLGRNLFFIITSPYLAIIFGVIFILYQLYMLGIVKIISV